jgi:NAD-dependent dihydropyrimidine dehydrogenase PreA subunit
MAIFIRVETEPEAALDPDVSKKLTEVCPVNIFDTNDDGTLRILEENLDECTLCELCLEAAPPGSVRIIKLYDEASPLTAGS